MKELIQTKKQLDKVLLGLDKQNVFSLDTETNGKFSQFEVQLAGLNIGWEDYGCYIPVGHLEGEQLDLQYVFERLDPFLLNEDIGKIYHHSKYDEMVCWVYGRDIKGPLFDTLIAARLFNELLPEYKLKFLVEHFLGYRMQTYDEVVEAAPRKRGEKKDYNFAKVPIHDAVSYAADDAIWTWNLHKFLEEKLKEEKVWDCYQFIESPLARVVRKMETTGILIDKDEIQKAEEVFPKLVDQLDAEVYEAAGEIFNVGSGPQLGRILFDKLKISENPSKTKTGRYVTDAKILKLYQREPIVAAVLRRKTIHKTYSTFVKGLDKHIRSDGRVHTNFNQVGTDTGRFSSDKPNLQNQQGDEIEDIKIRSFFRAAEGNKLIVADYSQIELRLLAHFSRDENMIAAFLSELRDFHDETARKMLEMQGKPLADDEEVPPRQRFHAKSLNFGIPYGRQDQSVAEMLGVHRRCAHWPTWNPEIKVWEYLDPETKKALAWTQKKAAHPEIDMCHNCGACFIRDWFSAFPRVEPFKEHVLDLARRQGYVRTLSGRKRRLHDTINSRNFAHRTHAERQAFNTKIQGSAGDIIKLAMIALAPKIEKLSANILLTVHDELVMEAPEDNAEEVVGIAKETMENPFNGKNPLILPLVVKPQICERWSEGK